MKRIFFKTFKIVEGYQVWSLLVLALIALFANS